MPPTFLGRREVGPLTISMFSQTVHGLAMPEPDRRSALAVEEEKHPRAELIRVHIDIERGGMLSPVENDRPTLDSDEGWRLYHQAGGEPRIVMHPPRFERPVWDATLAQPVSTVLCDDAMCISFGPDDGAIINPMTYPLDMLIGMHVMAEQRRGAIIHAAGLKLSRDSAVMFPGRSGAGKSTLSRLFKTGALLSDDRVILDMGTDIPLVWGTPWAGDAGIVSEDYAPLSAICFPTKGDALALRTLSRAEALERLLVTLSIPWYDETLASTVLDMCGTVLEKVPAYELTFTREDDPGPMVLECLASGRGAGVPSPRSMGPDRGEGTPAPP